MRPLLLAALLLLLAGCTTPTTGGPAPGDGRALAFERIEECQSRQGTELYRVVSTAAEWQQLWRQACGDGAVLHVMAADAEQPSSPPAVDFGRSSVVAAFWGEKPNGGFGVLLVNITELADHVRVDLQRIRAGEGCFVTQALSYPHDLAVTERLSKAARFAFEDKVETCA